MYINIKHVLKGVYISFLCKNYGGAFAPHVSTVAPPLGLQGNLVSTIYYTVSAGAECL